MMQDLFLVANVAGKQIAINAHSVEAVVQIDEVINVPRADPIVAGLCALRSRVLTLIDCQFRVTGQPAEQGSMRLAVIASVGNTQFGFLVEKVLDVTSTNSAELQPLPPSAGVWSDFVTGHVDINNVPVMVVDLERLVSRDPRLLAA
jgi:purine-binding chemotaxis protein CheW